MITAQRRAKILDYLREHGGGSIVEIAAALGASKSSIRRDLDHLAALGTITRSRGGAMMDRQPLTTFEPPRTVGAKTLRAEKAAVGRKAASLVEEGQSVIFDSGSTVLEAAKALCQRDVTVTVCTNDLEVAQVLSGRPNTNLIVLGGSLRPGSLTLVGEPMTGFLDRLYADVAFIGIHSIAGGRLSETSVDVSTTKRRMIDSAVRVVALVDSSKFEHPAFYQVCSLDEIDVVICDSGLPADARMLLGDSRAEMILVDAEYVPASE